MDGQECLSRMKKRLEGTGKKIPAVCVSAHALVGVREMVLAAGFDDYLSKPFSIDEFHEMVKNWLPSRKDSHEE